MSRRKKLFLIFLCFLILFNSLFPVKKAEAQFWGEKVKGAIQGALNKVGDVISAITGTFEKIAECVADPLACVIQLIAWIVHKIFWLLNNYLLAPIIDEIAKLNPFDKKGETSPVSVLWNILVNISFIVLSFSALFAGFQWLLGEDAIAKRLIFNIIIVALLINFSFVLVKEAFNVVQVIEKGISGEEYRVGSIIAASLWQKDPFEEMKQIMNTQGIAGTGGKIFAYLFIVIFDMIIFIVLIITLALILARYFFVIFLAGVSPLAFASLTFPEFKGALAETTANFRKFDVWLGHFVRWIIIIPIFIFLVLLGNIIKENTFSQVQVSSSSGLFEFVLVLLFMAFWYLLAIKFTVDFSKGVGGLAKAFAIGLMLTVGGLVARGLMMATSGKVGGFLSRIGDRLVEKAPPGFFGAQLKRVGEGAKKTGESLIERRYKAEADAVKIDMARYSEQLSKAKTKEEVQQSVDNINQVIRKYEKVPYVLKQANEELKKMPVRNFEKIAASEAASGLIGTNVPLEVRETFNDKLDKISKGAIKKIATDPEVIKMYQNASADVVDKFNSLVKEKLKEEDVLEVWQNENVRNLLGQEGFKNFRNSLNIVSKGLVEALISKDIGQISNSLSKMNRDFWERTGDINNALTAAEIPSDQMPTILTESIRKSSEPQNIIIPLLRSLSGDPIRKSINQISDKEFNDLLATLPPPLQAKLKSIRTGSGIIIASR